MLRALAFLLVFASSNAVAGLCGESGRGNQTVLAWSGDKEIGVWEVTDDAVHRLKLPEREVGVRVTPAPKEHYERLRHAGEWIPEIVKVEVLASESEELLVQGWGGANSLQNFEIEALGEGGLRLLLVKPVCVRVSQHK